MNVVLVAVGSAGDVFPFVAIGRALQQRGHRVTLLTNPFFGSFLRRAGFAFQPIGTAADFERVTRSPALWTRAGGFHAFWRHMAEPAIRPTYEFLRSCADRESCVVVASPFAFGARLAQETLGLRVITAYLQPAVLRTCYGEVKVAGVRLPSARALRGWFWQLLDRFVLDPLFAQSLDPFRRELGLGPVRNIMGEWIHSPQRGIALFPEWFAPALPDWPKQAILTDFPLYDDYALDDRGVELERFLAAGDAPIVFMPGSAMRHAAEFFQVSRDACVALGRRGIFLSPYPEQIPTRLPAMIRYFPYVPFSRLLRRAAAVVYHGGIGSCSQALRAGVAHLVMPMAHDQFDNAARVEALGVGFAISRRSYKTRAVVATLAHLLESDRIIATCREVAGKFVPGKFSAVCRLIESTV